ncbi:hypothetical protein PBI_RONRAYGUN_23 [Mycobacterium phage RonRayGun]|uniref:DUF7572 domain-containing protein n=1 Tax=Mycobacterium phage RonRayGun TaxID=1555234 RepID=A0A097EWE1_9CAUD|nr:hypothetical protein PBI_RONRAYGUN_23 [Mycobacterium phage RonRayGun]
MATATRIADVPGWAPGTQHYNTDDGNTIAVCVDIGPNETTLGYLDETLSALVGQPIAGRHNIIQQPTTIIDCFPDGTVEQLTPMHTFPPGTSHEDALRLAGYDITT